MKRYGMMKLLVVVFSLIALVACSNERIQDYNLVVVNESGEKIKELSFDEVMASGSVVSADGRVMEANETVYLQINNDKFNLNVMTASVEEAQSETYEMDWNQAEIYEITILKNESGTITFSAPRIVK